MAKALGSEIFEFYTKGWPEGHHYDRDDLGEDCFLDIQDDDKCLLDPAEKYDLGLFGYVVNDDTQNAIAFQSVFLKWKKQQTVTTLLVQVPKGLESEFRGLLGDRPEFKIL